MLNRRDMLIAAAGGAVCASSRSSPISEWLLLYYMNGKNSLAQYELNDFMELSAVESTDQVIVAAEVGRPDSRDNPSYYDGWSGVKRYRVTKGTLPDIDHALQHIGNARDPAADMGAPETLETFVRWASSTYPSKKKMLIICNHGQGWRHMSAPLKLRLAIESPLLSAISKRLLVAQEKPRVVGGFRSVSYDDDHGSYLYNSQIQTVLERCSADGHRMDIVAFDACLMSMIETAYALRKCADFMVASQELEPGPGWDHTRLLRSLVANPTMSPEELSKLVVSAYGASYSTGSRTTMAASKVADSTLISAKLSEASNLMLSKEGKAFSTLKSVRASLPGFADDTPGLGQGVDAWTLFSRLADRTGDPELRASFKAVAEATSSAVVASYASADLKKYGAQGLALYFPRDKKEFQADPYHGAYLPSNTDHPVQFVQDCKWSTLLTRYYGLG